MKIIKIKVNNKHFICNSLILKNFIYYKDGNKLGGRKRFKRHLQFRSLQPNYIFSEKDQNTIYERAKNYEKNGDSSLMNFEEYMKTRKGE